MALYEICTMLSRHRTSLVCYANFAGDTAAILAARKLVRRGESLEVRRGDRLVYRTAPGGGLLTWPVKRVDLPLANSRDGGGTAGEHIARA